MATFLTGGSGFLGSHLLRAMLAAGEEVIALVRAADPAEGRGRIERALARVGGAAEARSERLHVCLGDLSRFALGLDRRTTDRVVADCDQFLHCGATVRLRESIETARAVNLAGTKSVIELAQRRSRRGGVRRVDHVSTAFVAGNRTDLVGEDELDPRGGHKNAYERTKFEAEMAMRAAGRELPVTVHRPSLVVGDSQNGATSSFRTIYGPIRIYARGLWRTCPANPALPVDIVPVDFVRDAVMAIRRRPDTIGRAFHLAAGPRGSATIGSLAALLHETFPGRRPVRFVDPDRWARFVQPLLARLRVRRITAVVREGGLYLPYFARMPRFDVTHTRALGLEPPAVRTYIETILRYCIETDFGRRALNPAATTGRAGSTDSSPARAGTAAAPPSSTVKRPPGSGYESDNPEEAVPATARRPAR